MTTFEVIRNMIGSTGISLVPFGISGFAWTKSDAEKLINCLMDKPIGILGGDVYIYRSTNLEDTYANWYCNPNENESQNDFFRRSKEAALNYIRNYSSDLNNQTIFEIVFTEKVDPKSNESINNYKVISGNNCMEFILWCFPDFQPLWQKHLQLFNDQPRSLELDFCEFANFAISNPLLKEEISACIQFLLEVADKHVQESCHAGFVSIVGQEYLMKPTGSSHLPYSQRECIRILSQDRATKHIYDFYAY